jgi:transcriptional regulator with XRE-family HTH domain
MDLATATGQILRNLRAERGLTLHGVQERSKGSFKASALSGYERGERSISLERFHELTAFYSVPADVALKQVLELLGGKTGTDQVIDLTTQTVDVTDEAQPAAHSEDS